MNARQVVLKALLKLDTQRNNRRQYVKLLRATARNIASFIESPHNRDIAINAANAMEIAIRMELGDETGAWTENMSTHLNRLEKSFARAMHKSNFYVDVVWRDEDGTHIVERRQENARAFRRTLKAEEHITGMYEYHMQVSL